MSVQSPTVSQSPQLNPITWDETTITYHAKNFLTEKKDQLIKFKKIIHSCENNEYDSNATQVFAEQFQKFSQESIQEIKSLTALLATKFPLKDLIKDQKKELLVNTMITANQCLTWYEAARCAAFPSLKDKIIRKGGNILKNNCILASNLSCAIALIMGFCAVPLSILLDHSWAVFSVTYLATGAGLLALHYAAKHNFEIKKNPKKIEKEMEERFKESLKILKSVQKPKVQ